MGKGSYFKKPDYKSKGRMGIRKMYFSHLRVTLQALFVHTYAHDPAGGGAVQKATDFCMIVGVERRSRWVAGHPVMTKGDSHRRFTCKSWHEGMLTFVTV